MTTQAKRSAKSSGIEVLGGGDRDGRRWLSVHASVVVRKQVAEFQPERRLHP